MNKKRTIFNLGIVLSLALTSVIFLTFVSIPVFSQGNTTINGNNNSSSAAPSNNSSIPSNNITSPSGNTTNNSTR